MFYHYRQNNSGGWFDFDDAAGIGANVIIEADSATEADSIFESKGIEFGTGCPCCGSRWSQAWSDEGEAVPSIYGKPVSEYEKSSMGFYEGDHIYVHYKDGRIEKI